MKHLAHGVIAGADDVQQERTKPVMTAGERQSSREGERNALAALRTPAISGSGSRALHFAAQERNNPHLV